jgi:hypothetical protein
MALPPLKAGAEKEAVNCLHPRAMDVMVGASGTVLGVVLMFQTFDSKLGPKPFTALIFT